MFHIGVLVIKRVAVECPISFSCLSKKKKRGAKKKKDTPRLIGGHGNGHEKLSFCFLSPNLSRPPIRRTGSRTAATKVFLFSKMIISHSLARKGPNGTETEKNCKPFVFSLGKKRGGSVCFAVGSPSGAPMRNSLLAFLEYLSRRCSKCRYRIERYRRKFGDKEIKENFSCPLGCLFSFCAPFFFLDKQKEKWGTQ